MTNTTRLTNTFVGTMMAAAAGTTVYAALSKASFHPVQGLALLALAAATSRMKVKLPGLTGTMSVNLPFLLLAAVNLNSLEAAAVAAVCGLVQALPKGKDSWKPLQAAFNISMMVLATNLTTVLIHSSASLTSALAPMALSAAGVSLFLGQTIPVSMVIALTEGASSRRVWARIAHLSFPYYVASVGLTAMMEQLHHSVTVLVGLTALAVMYGIYRSYRTFFLTMRVGDASPMMAKAARA